MVVIEEIGSNHKKKSNNQRVTISEIIGSVIFTYVVFLAIFFIIDVTLDLTLHLI